MRQNFSGQFFEIFVFWYLQHTCGLKWETKWFMDPKRFELIWNRFALDSSNWFSKCSNLITSGLSFPSLEYFRSGLKICLVNFQKLEFCLKIVAKIFQKSIPCCARIGIRTSGTVGKNIGSATSIIWVVWRCISRLERIKFNS